MPLGPSTAFIHVLSAQCDHNQKYACSTHKWWWQSQWAFNGGHSCYFTVIAGKWQLSIYINIFTFSFALRILDARACTGFASGWLNTDGTRPSLTFGWNVFLKPRRYCMSSSKSSGRKCSEHTRAFLNTSSLSVFTPHFTSHSVAIALSLGTR